MPRRSSAADEKDWKYPLPAKPRAEGWLSRDHHEIYWHEYGSPHGAPVFFLHGGPGGGTKPKQARFFNPARYRIILFDQRGCGKSRPTAGDKDPRRARLALKNNTTDDLIGDINALREHLKVSGPMHVFGGSWGSTLSMAYAIQHPENVKTLILRGIFLCRREDLDYLYQGNATTWHKAPHRSTHPGAYISYPETWEDFVEFIPVRERADMVKAYGRIFAKANNPRLLEACKVWSRWEGVASYLIPETDVQSDEDPEFARTFARIENHYFMNGAFLGSGEFRDNQNYLLRKVHRFAHLPVYIIHGRFDQVCPRNQADELFAALQAARKQKKISSRVKLKYIVTTAGHSQYERETAKALTQVMDELSTPIKKRARAAAGSLR